MLATVERVARLERALVALLGRLGQSADQPQPDRGSLH